MPSGCQHRKCFFSFCFRAVCLSIVLTRYACCRCCPSGSQVKVLNKKQTDEIADHRRVLDREIEAQSHLYEREMEKVRVKGRQELDTKVRCTVHSSVFFLLF